MSCEHCQAELEDFLYGELAESQSAAVRAHLASCPACAQERDTLERENEIFAEYYEQTALEPAPEIWEAIRTRIQTETPAAAPQPEPAGWFRHLQTWLAGSLVVRQLAFGAALVLLSVAATTLYFKTQQLPHNELAGQTPAPTPTVPVAQPTLAPTPAATTAPPAENQLAAQTPKAAPAVRFTEKAKPQLSEAQQIQNQIARAEREYQGAIKLLDRVIARNRDQYAPGLLKQYETSLALIDNSIAESRRALRERPEAAASGQFLLAAYAKKLELMQEIANQAGQ